MGCVNVIIPTFGKSNYISLFKSQSAIVSLEEEERKKTGQEV